MSCDGTGTLVLFWWVEKCAPAMEENFQRFTALNMQVPFGPAVPYLGIHPEDRSPQIVKHCKRQIIYCGTICTSKRLKVAQGFIGRMLTD